MNNIDFDPQKESEKLHSQSREKKRTGDLDRDLSPLEQVRQTEREIEEELDRDKKIDARMTIGKKVMPRQDDITSKQKDQKDDWKIGHTRDDPKAQG